ncbi:MAG: tripartite tricarboxylate transporter TctB family protein [Advenella sp.]|uniref:tripartite tricarboxylate transporter TctB family protein n=1 Tax=Advenella sp. TaxID=1872388 RepID=UPI003F961557
MNNLLRRGDFWSGLTLASLGAYIVYQATQWEYMTDEGPGPGFFPIWYGGLMLILSLILMIGTVLKMKRSTPSNANWQDLKRVGICWTALVGAILATEYIGFYMAFAILIWLLATVLFEKNKMTATIASIAGAVVFFLLFSVGLDLDLPKGELFVNYFN